MYVCTYVCIYVCTYVRIPAKDQRHVPQTVRTSVLAPHVPRNSTRITLASPRFVFSRNCTVSNHARACRVRASFPCVLLYNICMYVYTYIYTHTHIYIYVYVYVYIIHIYICIYIYIYVYVYIYVYIYIYIYIYG